MYFDIIRSRKTPCNVCAHADSNKKMIMIMINIIYIAPGCIATKALDDSQSGGIKQKFFQMLDVPIMLENVRAVKRNISNISKSHSPS